MVCKVVYINEDFILDFRIEMSFLIFILGFFGNFLKVILFDEIDEVCLCVNVLYVYIVLFLCCVFIRSFCLWFFIKKVLCID